MLDKTDGRVLAGDWTELRTADLKRLWAEGSTAAQIAFELGGISRSAVLGKIHRLGIANTAPEMKRAKTAGHRRRQPGWRPVQWDTAMTREERLRRRRELDALRRLTRPQPLPEPQTRPDFLHLTFDQLSFMWDEATSKLIAKECRYPIGDDHPFTYCGQPTFKESYCEHCFRITHAPTRREAA